MTDLHFCIGLPRSGSTLLMNILNENPNIYTTGTCGVPYLFNSCRETASNVSEFIAMDMDVLDNSLSNFLRKGIQGWFESQTKKPVVISKSRVWDQNLRQLFRIYENPKFIITLRDPREIIISYEKLLAKYPHILFGSKEFPFEWNSLDKRIEYYCTDIAANLGRPLFMLRHVLEYVEKFPNNFFMFRWEDFNKNPIFNLQAIYNWLNLPEFKHNLNKIPQSDYIEHDAVYKALVSHKTREKFEPTPILWPKFFSEEQNATILHNLEWFYKTFYSDLINGNFYGQKFT